MLLKLSYSIIFVIILISFILPKWVLLIGVTTILMILSYSGLLSSVFSIDDADIWLFDIIIVIVALRSFAIFRIRSWGAHSVHIALVSFLVVMAVSSLLAYYRFGVDICIKEFIALLRLSVQVIVLPLITLSITTQKDVEYCRKLFNYIGYSIASSIYINILLFPYEFKVGEVQVTEESIRYFGLIGDQVGFILLFFLLWELLKRQWLSALVFGGAIIATGTRSALIAAAVGMGILFWKALKIPLDRKFWVGLIVSLIVFGTLIVQDLGSMRSRFIGTAFETGVKQRWLTMTIAMRVFLDHPLTGVGYTGFRFIADEYGARDVFGHWFAPNFIATAANQYLQVATDGGIAGLVSFFWLVFVLLKELRMAGKSDRFFEAAYLWLLSLLIGNQTAVWLLPGSLISYMLWLMVGLSIGNRAKL